MTENFGVENPLEKVEEEMKELEEKEHKHEKEERERSKFNSIIAITISIYAVLTAIAGLKESQITTDTLLEMDNAVLYQSQASDQWNFYQAKSIKEELYSSQAKALSASNETQQAKGVQKEFETNVSRYDKDKQDIETKGNELQKQMEEKLTATNTLVKDHHKAGMAVVFLQIAIVLASTSSLLRKKPLWYGSMVVAALGVGFLVPIVMK